MAAARRQYWYAQNSCQPFFREQVDKCGRWLAELLWPATCLLCQRRCAPQLDLCAGCQADLPVNFNACEVCGESLPGLAAAPLVCGACLLHPPAFHASFMPFRYAYPLDGLVRRLKFHRELACARMLGTLFAHQLLACRKTALPQAIVPVPLAPRRYRQRGYNQAIELALPICRVMRLPLRADLVIRSRETAEQAVLDRQERRRNLRRAFTMAVPLPARHVAILDDVVTTGSTAGELAKVLRRAGATRVEVWAIARAGR